MRMGTSLEVQQPLQRRPRSKFLVIAPFRFAPPLYVSVMRLALCDREIPS